MNPDTMRAVDRWVGVPSCFALTLTTRFVGLFRRAPRQTPIRRVAFVELSEMGSTILADPAMRKTRQKFGADLYFVIFKRNSGSLDFLGTVPKSNVYTIREDSLLTVLRDTVGFMRWMRRNKIDTVVDLELFSRFTALLCGISGAARRIGFHRFHNEGLYRGEFLTHRIAYNPHIHIAKNFIAMINALDCDVAERPYSKTLIADSEIAIPKVAVTAAAAENMRDRVRTVFPGYRSTRHRLVLFNPNASEFLPQRRWPRTNFTALARQVLGRWDDVLILITGAPSEEAEAEVLSREVGDERMRSFAGKVKLNELTALYTIADLMVTNDSGPCHFSSVTEMPAIVLFGPETPRLYGSLGTGESVFAGLACSPCVSAANHRKTACNDAVCMKAIQPAMVFERVAHYLSGNAAQPFPVLPRPRARGMHAP
jgi:ADP-heptose:LPS heptosyltransferase